MDMTAAITFVLVTLTGLLHVPITQWLKGVLKITDQAAFVLSAVVAAVLGALVTVAGGALVGFVVDLPHIYALATAIFTTAQIFYWILVKGSASAKAAAPAKVETPPSDTPTFKP